MAKIRASLGGSGGGGIGEYYVAFCSQAASSFTGYKTVTVDGETSTTSAQTNVSSGSKTLLDTDIVTVSATTSTFTIAAKVDINVVVCASNSATVTKVDAGNSTTANYETYVTITAR